MKVNPILGDERVFFQKGKLRWLLETSKKRSGLSWEKYSAHIGVSSYGVLRATYLSERNSLPRFVLRNAVRQFEDDDWKTWIVDVRDPHWGQAKGGKISMKSWHAKMRQTPEIYSEIQGRRFCRARTYKYTTSAGYEVRSLYELALAENLIVNRVPHQYERILRCGGRIMFPDFFIREKERDALIELCGFGIESNWRRLCQKLWCYKLYKVASLVIVVYLERDKDRASVAASEFGDSIRFVGFDDIHGLFSILRTHHLATSPIRCLSESEALKRCRQVAGKRIHWHRLLRTVPRKSWIETLTACGLPSRAVRRVRMINEIDTRLIEATRLADRLGFVPREALVEMIAGTCNGAAGDHFGSIANLIAAADSLSLEKFR